MASFVASLLSGGAGPLAEGVAKIINSIKGKNPEDAAKLEELASKYRTDILAADLEKARMDYQAGRDQVDVNLQEAKSDKFFIAGWRPAVGWACVAIFVTNFVVGPIVNWALILRGVTAQFPKMDLSEAMPVLIGMLGFGAYRTVEKVKMGKSDVGH